MTPVSPYRTNVFVAQTPAVIILTKEHIVKTKRASIPVNQAIFWRFPVVLLTMFTPLLFLVLAISLREGMRRR